MRGSIEMNIINKMTSKLAILVLAIAVLGTGVMFSGDNNVVSAEKLATISVTNKATGYTTEVSPPSARTAPASRTNASTVYVTMTDVNTSNTVQNSHIMDANKVVITVVEDDFNAKIAAMSGVNDIADADGTHNPGMTPVAVGKAGSPVIDTDGDGDLSDEVSVTVCDNNQVPTWNGTAFAGTCAGTTAVFQIVSVANGDSATNAASSPMVTIISNTASADAGGNTDGAGDLANGEDLFIGYYSSAVNTFKVKAWSTVQLEANASIISVVETGRNTGVFEAEFLVSDTEGANDGVSATGLTMAAVAAHSNDQTDLNCNADNSTITVAATAATDGRFDRSSGQDADCEWTLLSNDVDIAAADIAIGATGTLTAATMILAAGDVIYDHDDDGSILDSVFLLDDTNGGWANTDHGQNPTAITCGGSAAGCTDGTGGVVSMTITAGVAVDEDAAASAVPDVWALTVNNVVDNPKVDTTLSAAVDATDLKSGRIGSDTMSTAAAAMLSTGAYKTGVLTDGHNRTPIVEAQANAVITVQYQDLTDNSSGTTATTGTKISSTVTVDVDAPSPTISSPTAGTSFKDRQPGFVGAASDIGSGLDVSTIAMYLDIVKDESAAGDASKAVTVDSDDGDATTKAEGAYLAGAGPIDLNNRYALFTPVLDNTTTMKDGVTSATWTITTSANIPCDTAANDGTSVVKNGSATHSGFARAATTCTGNLTTPDVQVDYFATATDLAGNRGFSDGTTTDTDTYGVKDSYTFNIDELKPSVDSANTETGVYWNAGTSAEATGGLDKIVVAFDDDLSDAPASAFKVTLDSGTVLTPIAAEIGPKGTSAAGVSFDQRKNVYLTLGQDMATNETPKVELAANVSDLAGNTNKVGSITNAVDKIKPILTMTLSGGSGTGASGTSNDSDSLTKSSMTISITTSESLGSNPSVTVFSEDFGSGSSIVAVGDNTTGAATNDELFPDNLAAGATSAAITITGDTLIDTDKDGSLTDEVFLALSPHGDSVTAAELACTTVATAVNSGSDSAITLKNASTNNGSACGQISANDRVQVSANAITGETDATTRSSSEGTVVSVANTSTAYTATFSGAAFSDDSAKDSKAIVISATDTASNTGTLGSRDQGSASAYKFRLDKTAPVLVLDPDGDGTNGDSTTLPRPYVIYSFTDNSDVTVVTAKFGSDDVLSQLATTNNKKYFMVPTADLAVKSYSVTGKATDLAGNKGSETSYTLAVSSRKSYQATILAGWNLMSFPSNPSADAVGTVFSNSGIDQVVGYDAMSKGSPWHVATKDAATGTFSGSLSSISGGNGYWVHSSEFSTQSVSLTGPEGPSASAPPSISSIELASGWNLIGVVDATKALTQKDEGTYYKSNGKYLGACGGSSVTKAYEYNTTNLAWAEVGIDLGHPASCAADNATTVDASNVNIGEAFWVYAKPDSNGMLTPIVP